MDFILVLLIKGWRHHRRDRSFCSQRDDKGERVSVAVAVCRVPEIGVHFGE